MKNNLGIAIGSAQVPSQKSPDMKAFILAAGYGKRLRPLTETTPKPLLSVGGKPLIQYHIENLAKIGVTELVVNAHWLPEKLVDFLGDGSIFGVDIKWSLEEQLLETGGGIRKALPLLGDSPFILVNGDVYLEYSFRNLLNRALGDNLAHLVLVKNPEHHQIGDFCVSASGHLTRKKDQNDLTYTGAALINPCLLSEWQAEQAAFPLLSPLLGAMETRQLTGEIYTGLWEDVGTLERLNALNKKLG